MTLSAASQGERPSTRLIPVGEVAHLRVAIPPNQRWVNELWWQPIAYSEMHLCAHYYPLAIRFSHGLPILGVVLATDFVTRPLLDRDGMWQGAYQPMAVRTFPFQATLKSKDPLIDLVVPANTSWLAPDGKVALVDGAGQPSAYLKSVQGWARQLLESRQEMAIALDFLVAAGLLAPLAEPRRAEEQASRPQLFSVDRHRLAALDPNALGAMARRRFAPVDIAVACAFSQHLLRIDRQPKRDPQRLFDQHSPSDPGHILGLEDIAVDDGELFSLDDLAAVRESLETAGPPGGAASPE